MTPMEGTPCEGAGVVTSAGGSADLVLANTSLDIDAETVGLEGAWTKVDSAAERPARTAGTIVKDEGEGGKQLAEFLAGQKFI